MEDPTYCDYGDHKGRLKGFFRANKKVACLKCCEGMTETQYTDMMNKYMKPE